MYFDVSCLTDAGKALLTRASSGAKIIWGTCGCFTQQTPGTSSTYLTGKCASGSSSAVFESASNTATISCAVDNTESGLTAGYANSFGLWAKIDGDDDETLVLIAFVTTAHPSYFPTYSGASSKVGAIIDISVSVSDGVVSTINLTESAYALASNLQTEIDAREALENRVEPLELLADRTVTTHSLSSTTTGDDQTIYGDKTFKNEIHVSGISLNPGLYFGNIGSDEHPFNGWFRTLRCESFFALGWDGDAHGEIKLYSDLVPYGNGYQNIGSSSYKFNSVNATNVNATNVNATNVNATNVNSDYFYAKTGFLADPSTVTDGVSSIKIGSSDAYIANGYFYGMGIKNQILPYSNNGANLGSNTFKFNNIYATYIRTSNLYSFSGSTSITCNNNLLPASTGTYKNLGSSDIKWANVYADSLHGAIDSPIYNSSTSTFSLPVGAFVLAVLPAGSSHRAGETYNALNNSTLYALSISNGGTFVKDTNTPLPAGKYRLCSSTTPSGENFALVQYLGND